MYIRHWPGGLAIWQPARPWWNGDHKWLVNQ